MNEEQDLDIDNDINEDDVTDSEDLLFSTFYGIRIFHFSGSWDNIMLGVVLEEIDDSFLVALPASVAKDNNSLVLTGFSHVPYMRFMKSEFRALSQPTKNMEEAYVSFLEKEAKSVFPDLLSLIGKTIEDVDIEDSRVDNPPIEAKGIVVNSKGLSSKDIDDKVKKAIQEGTFVAINNTKN